MRHRGAEAQRARQRRERTALALCASAAFVPGIIPGAMSHTRLRGWACLRRGNQAIPAPYAAAAKPARFYLGELRSAAGFEELEITGATASITRIVTGIL